MGIALFTVSRLHMDVSLSLHFAHLQQERVCVSQWRFNLPFYSLSRLPVLGVYVHCTMGLFSVACMAARFLHGFLLRLLLFGSLFRFCVCFLGSGAVGTRDNRVFLFVHGCWVLGLKVWSLCMARVDI